MYSAKVHVGGSLQIAASPAFQFGTGDFTVAAMVATTTGGAIVSRKAPDDGPPSGGFLLAIGGDGSIDLVTYSAAGGLYRIVSVPTSVLDGDCHTVIGVRQGPTLTLLLDGVKIQAAPSGDEPPPVDVNNSLPVTIGRIPQRESSGQFLGAVMNVSLWSVALQGDDLVRAAFARVTGSEPGLQGYWTLDATGNDLSPNQNPAMIIGRVTFEYCLDCVWAFAGEGYSFCQIANMPDANAPTMQVTLSNELLVPAGVPALAMAIMTMDDTPTFPAGAVVTLTDPSGNVYNQETNTDSCFAHLSGGQLWTLVQVAPVAGAWHVRVTAPATTAFMLNIHTVPSADVVEQSRVALDPLFSEEAQARLPNERRRAMLGGSWWNLVTTIAVAALVGAAVVGVVILTGGTALPALALGVIAFATTSAALVEQSLPTIDPTSLPTATAQIAGMSGFVVAAGKLLLIDANVDSDKGTQIIYSRRKKKLYPAVTASSFNKVQSSLIGAQDTQKNVASALTSFASGYVTACGHGLTFSLTGWYVSGTTGPLQDVIMSITSSKFTPAQVTGRIFHFFACNTGYMGTDQSPGLGRAMVAAGAVAFFGYNVPFALIAKYAVEFCAPDIRIDLEMLNGETCDIAYQRSYDEYTANINTLRIDDPSAAAYLEADRDALVAPSTNTVYGNKTAKLVTST